jgi:hypothetical protein
MLRILPVESRFLIKTLTKGITATTVAPEMPSQVWTEIECCMDICRVTNFVCNGVS